MLPVAHLPPGAKSVTYLPPGVVPPCGYTLEDKTRCGEPSLYGMRLRGWGQRERAGACAVHAQAVRAGELPVVMLWALTGPDPWPILGTGAVSDRS